MNLRHLDLPRVAGIGIACLGALMLLVSSKSPWWRVPIGFADNHTPILAGTDLETGVKITLLCLTALWFGLAGLFTHRWTRALAATGLTWFAGALFFTHQLIISGDSHVDLALSISDEFDELTWLGGDIYTAREYEYQGAAEGIYLKDPPLLHSRVPTPYLPTNLSSLSDFFRWQGMIPAFWNFVKMGWGMALIGSLFLLIAALSRRSRNEGDRESDGISSWLIPRIAILITLWIAFAAIRVTAADHHLKRAQSLSESQQYPKALAALDSTEFWFPALASDTSTLFQRGLWELRLEAQGIPHSHTGAADLYLAFLNEQRGLPAQALDQYRILAAADSQVSTAIQSEARRGLMRQAVNAYNSSKLELAAQLIAQIRREWPTMPKAIYSEMILAVRSSDAASALIACDQLAATLDTIQKPEGRSAVASGRAHLAQLAFDANNPDQSWEFYHQRLRGK